MQCRICERGCHITEGKQGACHHYSKQGGEIREIYPNRYLQVGPIFIETMPMLHFYPGGRFLQVTTTGCNFNCQGCISAVIVQQMDPASAALITLTADEIIDEALKQDCIGITFVLNDPLASFYTFLELACRAKKKGLLVGCSSNAYFTEESLEKLLPYLDFINIGMKGISDSAYQACGASSAVPVLRNLNKIYEHGVHVEVSCMFRCDNREEVLVLSKYIGAISRHIPFQLMRFIPFGDADPDLEPSIQEAEELCKELRANLDYVYLFNSAGSEDINSYCPGCGELIALRDFYGPMGAINREPGMISILTRENQCPGCGRPFIFTGQAFAPEDEEDSSFTGGYPFTRSLEMMEAILICMGVQDKNKVLQVREKMLQKDSILPPHKFFQDLDSYIAIISWFGIIVAEEAKAEKLAAYMQEKIDLIRTHLEGVKERPGVYYAMGKPLFCIKGERLENQLVEVAGGISINRELTNEGRPGRRVAVEQINRLNPQYIFTSTFTASSLDEFYAECLRVGMDVEAVAKRRIFAHPAPGWDFGSPRWILGLMNIANILHPEIFHFDIEEEARYFYQEFYGLDFNVREINRSFSHPHRYWHWNDNKA